MSSAVGWPLGGAAGLVAAGGELVGPCANDGVTANVEQKRIAKETEVFMVALFQDAARSQAGLIGSYPAFGRRGDLRRTGNPYQPRTLAKTSGATMVASDSIMYFGVSTLSLPQVIFSLGTAPEYDPKLVVESLIWQK